ncbi:hypothetical protein [Cupriavidus basilensis]|uniref:hypothetical protein n=1 Tax=Cupriavidus basilensis TaxID=68895 RepID=UPI0005BA262B|nr:hypothetical protein [Cupriavidus basilensis]
MRRIVKRWWLKLAASWLESELRGNEREHRTLIHEREDLHARARRVQTDLAMLSATGATQ